MFYFLCVAVVIFLPFFAYASPAVVINEVAWAGTAADDTDEWVELKNTTGATISLDGWALKALDAKPMISLSGSIPAGGFYLVERTADTVISDVAGDYVGSFGQYGSVSNSGEDIDLIDDGGAVVDSVHFAPGWPAGTAGPDYFSMERIDPAVSGSSATNWLSNDGVIMNGKDAAGNSVHGTPRSENSAYNKATVSPAPAPASPVSSAPATSARSTTSDLSETRIRAFAGDDRTVLAGAVVEFLGSATVSGKSANGLNFSWNFGDGSTGKGRAISHTYFFPGTYSAQVNVVSDEDSVTDYLMVTVLAPQIVVTEVQKGMGGFIEIYNKGSERVDLGSLLITEGAKIFVIPKGTFIGAGVAIAFSNKVTALLGDGDSLMVSTKNGAQVDLVTLPAGTISHGSFVRIGEVLVYAEVPTPGSVERGKLASGLAVADSGASAGSKAQAPLVPLLAVAAKPTVLGAGTEDHARALQGKETVNSEPQNAAPNSLVAGEKNDIGEEYALDADAGGFRIGGFSSPFPPEKLFLAASILLGFIGSAGFLLLRA
ncbi:MAG: hypothetical protein A3I44_06025 [Candidatus Sungbacteria bacterium RIFCSPLOWO2_02_FULL_51_17]|uniref:PKD domain-containing protein n=1 Tax=Candidatus Sungbacteria bacterium RIFCSPHIGHO2_02_FULL_51_29 TaxID=1802273 RepID=A0A1G2KU15_9BACT|nr:MAG: hypothetical protein A2676_01550 [Candidatus Sungbacteria bacterium RIFCSPHIGHO2_01_FULL_51_22]OHA01889.1 MAG: hypothetical protein A3C16_03285 [Candidatus Sungbacteria bacterium RIFCSPHIGHO2_02_FULL_51_29]OHA07508.1 MAG: hypothetical protein A3B29_02340 [Candidatus Sungbacteria bacterium RIFCSPLOWO2_01_FULL_51_34]OHA12407.1 MAG: hypothetical protein A3I44_06025 [Candidatus Sungbacteria bacterium RIFCSPLOWO2_02_FULL_51_17]